MFAIKLLGISETTDTRFASRFIATAFTAHPGRDYCIISIPNKMHISRSVEMLLGLFVVSRKFVNDTILKGNFVF